MQARTDLWLFTGDFPFGHSEDWLDLELSYLLRAFRSVSIVPLRDTPGRAPRQLPERVRVLPPILPRQTPMVVLHKGTLNAAPIRFAFAELVRRTPLRARHLREWLSASLLARAALAHSSVRQAVRESQAADVVWYFYWADAYSSILPVARPGGRTRAVCRFHGLDLYEDRHSGYIPFRKPLLQSLDVAATVSEHGRQHLLKHHADSPVRVEVARLAIPLPGNGAASTDGTLRIVSCSYAVPVKRLHLIVEALRLLSIPIQWTHIGDGPLLHETKSRAATLPPHVSSRFLGFLLNAEVLRFYETEPCDAFLNVSKSEGAPVSIMEAMGAGIPVIATAVGGTPELAQDVGVLLPADPDPAQIAEAIKFLAAQPSAKREAMRRATRQRAAQLCDPELNYGGFARMLRSLISPIASPQR